MLWAIPGQSTGGGRQKLEAGNERGKALAKKMRSGLINALDTVNAKLSATVAYTETPALMETSILPDPPNVPPTAIV